METSGKILYATLGLILPLVLLFVDIYYFEAAIFPMIWLFMWLGFSIFIILPWSD